MAFRRYGGDWHESKGRGANKKIAYIGVYILVISSMAALTFQDLRWVAFGFVALFLFTIIAMAEPISTAFEFSAAYRKTALNSMLAAYEEEDYKTAKVYLDMAVSQGAIPSIYDKISEDIEAKTKR